MNAHQIDHGTAAIVTQVGENNAPWIRILFNYPGASLISGEAAIRNLRAACDAALGEGEEK